MKVCLWPRHQAENAFRLREHLAAVPGVQLVEKPVEGELVVFVHASASPSISGELSGLAESYAGQLVVSVVANEELRWHLFEPARILFSRELAWRKGAFRVPAGEFSEETLIEVDVLQNGCVVHAVKSELDGGDVVFELPDKPHGDRVRVTILEPGCREEDADQFTRVDIPGYTRFDPQGRVWRTVRNGGEAITGRQNAPEFLRVSSDLMAGTADQFASWRELVAAGRARGVRIKAHG